MENISAGAPPGESGELPDALIEEANTQTSGVERHVRVTGGHTEAHGQDERSVKV
jgi:hypothetical protein